MPTDLVACYPEPTPLASSEIMSVGLQARAGIAISSDKEGVVKSWDISTGHCKESFQTPARDAGWNDARLLDDGLIVVWCKDNKIYIWGTHRNVLPRMVATLSSDLQGLRISGDGSKAFCLFEGLIQAWSTHTGEPVGEVKLELEEGFYLDPFQMDGSKILIRLKDLSTQGWDFSVLNSPPVPLSDGSTERPLLDLVDGDQWQSGYPLSVKSTATRKEVFQLSCQYPRPGVIQWNGQYLVAGYESGKVLILDFCHLYPQ